MAVVFFKRFRMQIDLRDVCFQDLSVPEEYQYLAWRTDLLNAHAEVKYRSFRNEMDVNVFPALGDAEGCLRLMREISSRQGFVPKATWLMTFQDQNTGRIENCGTVQGVSEKRDVGSIQNVGIVHVHRDKGIGTLLIQQSLHGFQQAGIRYVRLEVTSHNKGACRLYERLGFRYLKTVYKSLEIDSAKG